MQISDMQLKDIRINSDLKPSILIEGKGFA